MLKKILFYTSLGAVTLTPLLAQADTTPLFDNDNLFQPKLNIYFRSGIGTSSKSGGTKASDNYAKQMVGRLGNEYDTYSEIGLGEEVYNKDGRAFYVDSMFSMDSNGYSESENTSDNSSNFGLKQLNIRGKGLITSNPDAIVWAGKRFYQRHDLHIIDTKYWNISGYGAGIEDFKAGPGKLAVAWMRNDSSSNDTKLYGPNGKKYDDNLNVNIADVRYSGLSPWEGSWMELGIDYAMPNKTDGQKHAGVGTVSGIDYKDAKNGVMLTAVLGQKMFSQYTTFVAQYANKGMAQNMTSQGGGWYDSWNDTSDATGYRFINTSNLTFGKRVSVNYVLIYGHSSNIDAGGQDQRLISFVTRPIYQWDNYNKTMAEIGYFNLKRSDTSNSDSKGHKITIAQAWSAGPGLYARPEIRLFATYVKFDSGPDSEANQVADGNSDHDFRYGVQGEVWW
ncbi:maltoporin LamB [Celerinatantimonas sp. YJH-8]|uniref:maltoporin LamB n=1 Tax=Celerinatantimonas sp. YJH-8 TaxID=3228714 RepID=UPI0038C5A1DE